MVQSVNSSNWRIVIIYALFATLFAIGFSNAIIKTVNILKEEQTEWKENNIYPIDTFKTHIEKKHFG